MSIIKEDKKILKKERRDQIQSAALKLFYNKGYSNTTVDEIAKQAEISKGLIYHYFKSKKDILFSLEEPLQTCLEELKELKSTKEAISEFGRRFFEKDGYIAPLKVFIMVFLNGELNSDEKDHNPLYQNLSAIYFEPLFARGIKEKEFKEGNPYLYAAVYWNYLLGCFLENRQGIKTNEECLDTIDEVLSLFE